MTEINEWKKIPIFSIIFWAVKAILKCVKKKNIGINFTTKKNCCCIRCTDIFCGKISQEK